MASRPAVAAFDVIETVFSLESLRAKLQAAGLSGHLLEVWFAQILRDAFALDATGVYRSFRDVASAALADLLASFRQADATAIDQVMADFSELDECIHARDILPIAPRR